MLSAATTRIENRCAAGLARRSCGFTFTATALLAVLFVLTVYVVFASGCVTAVNAPAVAVCTVATFAAAG